MLKVYCGYVQGLFVGCIYVGSGDPVGVLCLLHNEYAGYTLKHLLLRYMYKLSLPKLCATLLVTLCSLAVCSLPMLMPECAIVLYCTMAQIVSCVDITRTVFRDRSVLHLPGKALTLVAKLLLNLTDTQVIS